MVHQPANRKMTLSRVPVGMKIMSGVLVAGVGILVIMAVAMLDLSHMKAAQTALQQRALAPLTAMSEVRRAYLQTRIDALTDLWIDSRNGAAYEAYASDKKQMTAALKELDRVTATPHQRDQAAKLASAWTTYLEGVDDPAFKAAARSRDLATYAKIRDDHVAPAATEIKETAEAMRKDIAGQAQTQEMASRRRTTRACDSCSSSAAWRCSPRPGWESSPRPPSPGPYVAWAPSVPPSPTVT